MELANPRMQTIQAKYFLCTSPLFICKMAFLHASINSKKDKMFVNVSKPSLLTQPCYVSS